MESSRSEIQGGAEHVTPNQLFQRCSRCTCSWGGGGDTLLLMRAWNNLRRIVVRMVGS